MCAQAGVCGHELPPGEGGDHVASLNARRLSELSKQPADSQGFHNGLASKKGEGGAAASKE